MEAVDTKVYQRLESIQESKGYAGGSEPGPNLLIGREYIENVLNTISGFANKDKFAEFARRMIVNAGDLEHLVDIFSRTA